MGGVGGVVAAIGEVGAVKFGFGLLRAVNGVRESAECGVKLVVVSGFSDVPAVAVAVPVAGLLLDSL